MPFPGAFNDGVERLELRLPAKLLFDLVGGSDEPRWIAGPAWFFDRVDFSTRDFAAGFNYCSNAGTAAGTEIVTSAVGCAEGQNMRLSQIADVNVVADTCPIRCVVIGSIYVDIRSFTEGRL